MSQRERERERDKERTREGERERESRLSLLRSEVHSFPLRLSHSLLHLQRGVEREQRDQRLEQQPTDLHPGMKRQREREGEGGGERERERGREKEKEKEKELKEPEARGASEEGSKLG